MARVRVVLVHTENAANVGAAARAVVNAGLEGLDLVEPGDWRTVECWRTAWGATRVLETARVFESLRAAVAESTYVVGFSRRGSENVTLDVRDAASDIAALPADATAALVFGSETSGLTLEARAACGRVAFIPSHPAQPSLNLSQAVMVAAYEVLRGSKPPSPRASLATQAEKERVLALLLGALRRIHALSGAEHGVYARLWRGLLLRMDLTPREARLVGHMGRKIERAGGSPHAGTIASRSPASLAVKARGGGRSATAPTDRPTPSTARASPRRPEESSGHAPNPFTDVRIVAGGFSIPVLKWRELLFVGALRPEGDVFRRDPERPLPPFERDDLFPESARFAARAEGDRVVLRRLAED